MKDKNPRNWKGEEKKSIRSQKREDQKESVVTIEKDSLGEEK